MKLTFGAENARAVQATEHEHFIKVVEEFSELAHAGRNGEDEHAMEEAVDLMRATDGWIAKQPDDAMRATVRAVQEKECRRGDA